MSTVVDTLQITILYPALLRCAETTGPYHYIRHPIYTAVCLFGWAGMGAHWSWGAAGFGCLMLAGSLVRIHCEEILVTARYPEYTQYKARTARMIPFVY